MVRLMVEGIRPAPKGWRGYATAKDLINALRRDAGDIAAVAIAGTIDECAAMLEAVANAANQQFHLLGGTMEMERIHFHDPDLVHARACREHALSLHKDQTLPKTDVSVPIGDWSVWIRDEGRLVVTGMTLPESAMLDMVGRPVSRLVETPMLPEGMVVTGFTDHPRDLYISIETPETRP